MWKYLKTKKPETSDDELVSHSNKPKTDNHKASEKIRHYNENYLSIGFTWSGDPECPLPLCVICRKQLSNEAMVPSKLSRHFKTHHKDLQNKNINYFKSLLASQRKQSSVFVNTFTVSEKAQEASYLVAELIAQNRKNHSIGENLIMPACKIIVSKMFGEEFVRKIENIPLSNNTISRRISDMSYDVEDFLCDKLKNSKFSIQVDESIDLTNKCYVVAFVRFVNEGEIQENFLCCKELVETSKAIDIFNILSLYLENKDISWKNCIGICTDGAASMVGSIKGLVTLIKEKNANIISTHCFIHREVLMAKYLDNDLQTVFDDIIKMVNFIKRKPVQSRIFKKLCENMDKSHINLLLHTEIRWLSRGKVFNRVFELKDEIHAHFQQINKQDFAKCFDDPMWVQMLAYMADIFCYLNQLNKSLQGSGENILTSSDKILGFKRKLQLWKDHVAKKNLGMFELLSGLKSKDGYQQISRVILPHLEKLLIKMDHYFPSLSIELYDWVRNPFSYTSVNIHDLTLKEEQELCDLQSDRSLKMRFDEMSLSKLDIFWISVESEYPTIHRKAMNILLQFSTSYMCEQAFSCLRSIKTKDRNRLLSVEDEIRVCISKIRPRFHRLYSKKQAQISH